MTTYCGIELMVAGATAIQKNKLAARSDVNGCEPE
jgi:hypothetical protein